VVWHVKRRFIYLFIYLKRQCHRPDTKIECNVCIARGYRPDTKIECNVCIARGYQPDTKIECNVCIARGYQYGCTSVYFKTKENKSKTKPVRLVWYKQNEHRVTLLQLFLETNMYQTIRIMLFLLSANE